MKTSVRIHCYKFIHTNNFSAHPHLLAWPDWKDGICHNIEYTISIKTNVDITRQTDINPMEVFK